MPNFDHRYRRIFIESVTSKKTSNLLFGPKMRISYILKPDWLLMNNGTKLVKTGPYKTYTNEKYHL